MSEKILIVGSGSDIAKATVEILQNQGIETLTLSRSEGEQVIDLAGPLEQFPNVDEPLAGLVYFPGTINLKPFASLKEEDFRKDWELNCLFAVKVIQKYLENLKKSENASIVLMSSVAVEQGMPFHASIASAKAAVEGLTKSLAAELAPKVRVNAVAPSLTNTKLGAHLLDTDTKKQNASKRHPLQRIGEAQDIAEAVCYLLTSKSRFVTGQVLHVDGGFSSLKVF